jgi:hypothetical protein
MWGSLDEPERVPPKGEFFCKSRPEWMPELEGMALTVALMVREGERPRR